MKNARRSIWISMVTILIAAGCVAEPIPETSSAESATVEIAPLDPTQPLVPTLEISAETPSFETNAVTAPPLTKTVMPRSTVSPSPQTDNEGSWSWRRTNPGGGGAFAAAEIGPDGTYLVASDLSGAYLSDRQGELWRPIGRQNGLLTTHVSSLAFDPEDADILYLGTEAGIYRSEDGGETVTEVLPDGYITDIRIPFSDPSQGYAASHSGFDQPDGMVYSTTDRGVSWQPISASGLPAPLHILKLFIDPLDPNLLYLLSGEGRFSCSAARLYLSNDGGANWEMAGDPTWQVIDFGIDPTNPDHLWLTTYGDVWDGGYACVSDDPSGGHLYESFDRGGTWEQVTNQTGNYLIWTGVEAMRLIEIDFGEVFAVEKGGRLELIGEKGGWGTGWSGFSHTYGASFNGDVKTFAVDPNNGNHLLWIDSQFVYRTIDGGRTFQPLNSRPSSNGWQSTGIDNIVMFDFAISADGMAYYAAMPDLGCFYSPDQGSSWVNCNTEPYVGNWFGHGGNSMTVVADPFRPAVAWMTMANEIEGAPHTLLRTDNQGLSWVPIGSGLPEIGIPSGLSVDPHSPESMRTLFLTVDGDVYRSTDDGQTWQLVFECDGCRTTAVDGAVFAGGEAGLFRSAESGDLGSWVSIGTDEMQGGLGSIFWDSYWDGVADIEVDPANQERILAAVTGRGLYYSDDSGASWGLILDDMYLRDVAFHPARAGEIWAGSSSAVYSGGYLEESGGLLVSQDGGETWGSVDFDSVWPFVNTITFDPTNRKRVVIGSTGTGFYIGENNGRD